MMLLEKKYSLVTTIFDAIQIASQDEKHCKFIAGGTDVMVNKYQGNETATHLIDISKINELKGIRIENDNLIIGSLTKLNDLKKSDVILNEFPVLIEAANAVGSPLIRKTATIGGNILCENRCIYYNQSEWWREAVGYCLKCNGNICIATGGKKACFSEFVSDTAPTLISMNAKVKLVDLTGEKILPIESLFTGDGVKPKTITNTTLLKEIILPLNQQFKSVFKKLRLRETLEFTSLTTAVTISNTNSIRIVLGGVDPKPVLIEGNLNDDVKDLVNKAFKGARAVENDMFTRTYRREMINVYLTDSFKQLGININSTNK
jgi:4-hydroxybenzoyl-CoA reductase subunit beta